MARIARKVLDLGIISFDYVRPVVSQGWSKSKAVLGNTFAKKLINNRAFAKVETKLFDLVTLVASQMRNARSDMLKRELRFLEEETEKIRKRVNDGCSSQGESCQQKKKICGSVLAYVGMSLKNLSDEQSDDKEKK